MLSVNRQQLTVNSQQSTVNSQLTNKKGEKTDDYDTDESSASSFVAKS